MGVEPTCQPWEGRILPMNYTRMNIMYYSRLICRIQPFFGGMGDEMMKCPEGEWPPGICLFAGKTEKNANHGRKSDKVNGVEFFDLGDPPGEHQNHSS